ncbi:MAG: MBL fold metallo-hydrolase [Oscillospiraceae bacterium]|nr:MBL fold metallo-hydrolase [Oscillospiraceae bacterium]
MKRRSLTLLLALTLLLTACASPKKEDAQTSAADLTVHFFDAGKADATLLTTADGAVLIDAGEKGFGKTILAYLEEQGIERLDYLIVTHFDQDHVGGAAKVINNLAVGTVLQSNCPKDSEEYEKYCKALSNAGLEALTVRENVTFTLGGATVTVEPPRQTDYSEDESNNSSLIVTVENGTDSFLFLGDAQSERLAEFLSSERAACDVLKVAHHGQDEPLLSELLAVTKPAYAVITSSDEEPESAAVVEALEQCGASVLLTREGAVTMHSTGDGITLDVSPAA